MNFYLLHKTSIWRLQLCLIQDNQVDFFSHEDVSQSFRHHHCSYHVSYEKSFFCRYQVFTKQYENRTKEELIQDLTDIKSSFVNDINVKLTGLLANFNEFTSKYDNVYS